jgi:CHAT domain-containing protein/Tfp pilus assembly protein PilF
MSDQGRIRQALTFLGVLALIAAGFFSVDIFPASAQTDEAASLNQQAEKLYKEGRFSDAIPLAQRALAIRENALGPDHPDVADILNKLAILYHSQGRYADAEPLYKRSLAIRAKVFGPGPDVGASLNNLAELYRAQGRYAEAEPIYKLSLSIREKTLGPDHPDVASSLNNLAAVYSSQGRYADAEPLYRRSLAIREKTLGPDHLEVAHSMSNIAILYDSEGRYANAEPLLKRSLAIQEKNLDPNHPDVATSLQLLAGLYQKQGRYAEAEPLLRRSLAIRQKTLGPDHPEVAQSLNNLANLYHSLGRYVDAEPLFKQSLAIHERVNGRDHPDVGTSLNNLANLYFAQGRYADAEPLLKRSLAIEEKVLGPDHPAVATSLNNLANLYKAQARYADAEPLLKRSFAIREKTLGPDHPAAAASLNNLANLYSAQGRYTDAEPLLKRSLAIEEKVLGPDHPDLAASLTNLASFYARQRNFVDAERLLKRSLAIQEKILGADHPNVALTMNTLATVYATQNRYADAEPLFKQSLAIGEMALGHDHPDVANWLNNFAAFYISQRRYADAERLDKEVLAIRESTFGPDHPAVAESLNNLAMLYLLESRYADALRLVRTATERGFERKWVSLSALNWAAYQSLIKSTDALNEGYQVIQRGTSSAASNAINQLSVRFAAGNDQLAELVRKDQDLTSENERLDKNIVEAVSREPLKRNAAEEQKIRDRLQAIATERTQIEATLRQSFPDFAALAKPAPLSVQETQTLLADDEALIILDFDQHSYAGIITRTSADGGELKITPQDLEVQVKSLRSSLIDKTDAPFNVEASYRLYQSVFGSFADKFASKKRLSVVTNGALTSIPLQLLVTKNPTGKKLKDVDWFVRSHAITVLPSVASLKTLRSRAPIASPSKPMIAFADPVFSKMDKRQARQQVAARGITSFVRGTHIDIALLAEHLVRLPWTRVEVQSIAKALRVDPSDIRLGLDATETAVKDAKLDQYRIVYFATHGLVAGNLEEFAQGKVEPALALSIPDKPNDFDDGLLFASEVAQLKLNADWVVLSACNTAAEDRPGAEALSGLARAFFYAGARSLLVSHWEVDDKTTAKLMTTIFQLTRDNPKLSHGEALQQSILAILDRASSDEELHPRLWAPFVVVGEPEKPH